MTFATPQRHLQQQFGRSTAKSFHRTGPFAKRLGSVATHTVWGQVVHKLFAFTFQTFYLWSEIQIKEDTVKWVQTPDEALTKGWVTKSTSNPGLNDISEHGKELKFTLKFICKRVRTCEHPIHQHTETDVSQIDTYPSSKCHLYIVKLTSQAHFTWVYWEHKNYQQLRVKSCIRTCIRIYLSHPA